MLLLNAHNPSSNVRKLKRDIQGSRDRGPPQDSEHLRWPRNENIDFGVFGEKNRKRVCCTSPFHACISKTTQAGVKSIRDDLGLGVGNTASSALLSSWRVTQTKILRRRAVNFSPRCVLSKISLRGKEQSKQAAPRWKDLEKTYRNG